MEHRSLRTATTLSLCTGLVVLGSPARAMERVRQVDLTHVSLDLRFDWGSRQAHGTAALTFSPLRPTRVVTFDAARLRIASISTVSGTSLRFRYDGSERDDALRITLDREYSPTETLTVRVSYRTSWVNRADPNALGGSNGRGLRFFEPTLTEPRKRRQLWSMGEPEGNRFWFPSYDAPDDLRTTELRLTVPESLVALGTGQLLSADANADGTRTFRFVAEVPHANHLTSIVVGDYVDVPQRAGDVMLHSLGYPDEVDAVRASVVRLPEMLAFFSRVTGTPYPGASYTQAFVQDLGWGIGGPGASILTENMIDDARTHDDYYYLWDGLEAEALAAQWFGALISFKDWRHAWLSRGFAHYFDALFSEFRNGRNEALLWNLGGDLGAYLASWKGGIRQPLVPAQLAGASDHATGTVPYSRGALVLHMLRAELGDDLWWKVVRTWVTRYAGQTPTTADFQRTVTEVSGASWDWFFDQWVFGAGHPVFHVTSQYNEARHELTLAVTQNQKPDSATPSRYFQGVVQVTVDDAVHRVRLLPQRQNTFTLTAGSAPRLVAFDRESIWIKEITFIKPVEDLVYQARHDGDVTGQVWAVRQLGAVAMDTARAAVDRHAARDGLRQVVDGAAFWRVRYTALLQLQNIVGTPGAMDPALRDAIQRSATRDTSWVRSVAIAILGTTRDSAHVPLYLDALRDKSHPVNHAAAIALGQSRSGQAFDVLTAYMKTPSWKGENVLCGLAGLQALGDPRAAEVARDAFLDTTAVRWYLATSRWDFRIAAAEVLQSLGRSADVSAAVHRRFRHAMQVGDVNDIFSNVLLAATLGDHRGREIFARVRSRFARDANALTALAAYEQQWRSIRSIQRRN